MRNQLRDMDVKLTFKFWEIGTPTLSSPVSIPSFSYTTSDGVDVCQGSVANTMNVTASGGLEIYISMV